MATPNAKYWAERLRELEEALLEQGMDFVENLEDQFDRAIASTEKEIATWYQRFANNNAISYSDARKWLTNAQLDEFRWTVQEYIRRGEESALTGQWIKELENASDRVHISRLDALKLQLQQQAEVLHGNQLDGLDALLRRTYTEGYYVTAYELQRGIGTGWTMHSLDENVIRKALSRPWTADGETFSDRVWTNKQALVNSVNQHLTQMIIRGEGARGTIDAIAKDMGVAKQKAARLVMTESAAFASMAQQDCFNELGVEDYVIVATLDADTSEICQSLDGKVFKMSEYAVGLTAPPFHPWCRTCTAPWFEDMAHLGERYARDIETGETFTVPRNMTYDQWRAMQNDKYGAGTVENYRVMHYNESADHAQYDRYTQRLGDLAPGDFTEFQRLKYQAGDEYDNLMALYRYKGVVPEATAADFEAYKRIQATGIKGTIRVPPQEIGVDISELYLDVEHVAARGHGVTESEARRYIEDALFSVNRKHWSGALYTNYYSSDGAAYVNTTSKYIRTAFKRDEYDTITEAAVNAAR